ncbi:hypothetical protein BKH46_08945 [Helicobacter sp. 12S02634-8]|uniref:hypothetical protein n=1 Tax=Helicobacter sp. 12S02634-8 TaxID=1476199 RepID=UPI000BA767A4|nr:hypothetical protein [Helicobacter sp. 12S02634-8]PAF46126.1 hypothetical protein BKH46_08945 [Helicobacter sp. 12S02634-8]
MANNANKQKENLYFSGGRVEIAVFKNDGSLDTPFNLGCIELTLNREITKAQAFSKEQGSKQKIAEVITDENVTLKMKCNDFSAQNLALALGAKVETLEVKTGEALPFGGNATKDTTLSVLKAGSVGIVRAKITFISTPVLNKKVAAVIHEANISMSGDLALMNDGDFATLELEGSANATDAGYYTHYIIEEERDGTPKAPKA